MTRKRTLFDGTVDAKCRELVDHFLPADADEIERMAMAQNIQDVVDDWLADWVGGARDAPLPTE